MKSIEAYKKFLLKINKNDSNSNINISKGEFVLIFNEQARRWLREKINVKESSDRIDDISELLVSDLPLTKLDSTENSVEFQLPDSFFDYVSSYSSATKRISYTAADGQFMTYDCTGTLHNWNIKNKNVNTYIIDQNNRPSFEFEETFVVLNSNKIKVYRTDFDIQQVFISYYINPPAIDIEGYKKISGEMSTNVDPIFSDTNTDEIISRCAIEVARSYENPQAFQLAKERVLTED